MENTLVSNPGPSTSYDISLCLSEFEYKQLLLALHRWEHVNSMQFEIALEYGDKSLAAYHKEAIAANRTMYEKLEAMNA